MNEQMMDAVMADAIALREKLERALGDAREAGRKEGYEEAVGTGELNLMSGVNNAFARGQAYGEHRKAAAVQAEHEATVEDVIAIVNKGIGLYGSVLSSDLAYSRFSVRHVLGELYVARTKPKPDTVTVTMFENRYKECSDQWKKRMGMVLVDPPGEKE